MASSIKTIRFHFRSLTALLFRTLAKLLPLLRGVSIWWATLYTSLGVHGDLQSCVWLSGSYFLIWSVSWTACFISCFIFIWLYFYFILFFFVLFSLVSFNRIWGSRMSFTRKPSSSASMNCVNVQLAKSRNHWLWRPMVMMAIRVVMPA
jgi:hypothetical protein